MSGVDQLVREALERDVPLRLERAPDWDDVIARTELARRTRGRRALATAAIAAALVVVASTLAAVGHSPFGAISSWLNGAPGERATSAEQAGFTGRNGASYAAFPAGIEVHRVARAVTGGQAFRLLGFASGHSLCLRLVPAGDGAPRGASECVTRDELAASAAPALVASEAHFYGGRSRPYVDGIFGFADDTVRAIEVRRGRGPWSSVPVTKNVFVALAGHTLGTPRHPSQWEPIAQVRAVTRSGERIEVPFVAGYASYQGGVPSAPSYLAVPNPDDVPGPTAIAHAAGSYSIGWLARGDKRGAPWQLPAGEIARIGTVVHARVVQPDPDDPYRVALVVVRTGPRLRTAKVLGRTAVCAITLRPLGGTDGVSCMQGRDGDGVLAVTRLWGQSPFGSGQRTHVAGAVPDGVASLRLYLSSGRVIPVPLRDNAYSVSAPTGQLPARLVAYDDAGRVIGIQAVHGPARPVPCPTVSAWPVSKLPATQPYQRLDLGALTLNGAPIFGRSPAEVKAILGKPVRDAVYAPTGEPSSETLYYGGFLPSAAELVVRFDRRQGRLRADNLDFHGRGLADAKLGRVLNEQPQALQDAIAAAYGGTFGVSRGYGSLPGFLMTGCTGELRDPRGVVHVSFGVETYSGRPFLSIRHMY